MHTSRRRGRPAEPRNDRTKERISVEAAYGERAECHFSNLRHEPLVLMVVGHIPCRVASRIFVPFDITLRSCDSHPRTRTVLCSTSVGRWIGQGGAVRADGLAEDRRKKRGRIAVFTSGRPLVTLRKSRQSRRSRLSPNGGTTRHVPLDACAVAVDCARHFHTFYVNREIWCAGECAKKKGINKRRQESNARKRNCARIESARR